MIADLFPRQTVNGDFDGADNLKGEQVESKDVKRVVSDVNQAPFDDAPFQQVYLRGKIVNEEKAGDGWQQETCKLLEVCPESHAGREEAGAQNGNGQADKRRDVVERNQRALLFENEADAHQVEPHELSVSALGQSRHAKAAEHLPQGKEERAAHNHPGDFRLGAGDAQPLEQLEEYQEQNARYEEGAEEPERAAQELVVARHVEQDAPQALAEFVPGVGMEHAAGGVAVGLTQNAQREKQVVEAEQDQAPFDKRHVEPLYTVREECTLLVQVLGIEEIAGTDEKDGDMELENPVINPARSSRVRKNDQDNRYGLADRK